MLSGLSPDDPATMTAWNNALDRQAITDSISDIIAAESAIGGSLTANKGVKNENIQLIFDSGNTYSIDRTIPDKYTLKQSGATSPLPYHKESVPSDNTNRDELNYDDDEDYYFGPSPGM